MNYSQDFYNSKTQEFDVVYFQLVVLSIAMQRVIYKCQSELNINLTDVLVGTVEKVARDFESETANRIDNESVRARLSLETAPIVEHIHSLYKKIKCNKGILNNMPPLEIAANVVNELVQSIVNKMEVFDVKVNKDNANVLATTLTLKLEVEFSDYKICINKFSHDDNEDFSCYINGVDCPQAEGYMQWVIALLKAVTYTNMKSVRNHLCCDALKDNESIARLAKDAAAIMGGESKYYLSTCLDVRQELQTYELEYNQELAQILIAAYGLDEDKARLSVAKLANADR